MILSPLQSIGEQMCALLTSIASEPVLLPSTMIWSPEFHGSPLSETFASIRAPPSLTVKWYVSLPGPPSSCMTYVSPPGCVSDTWKTSAPLPPTIVADRTHVGDGDLVGVVARC